MLTIGNPRSFCKSTCPRNQSQRAPPFSFLLAEALNSSDSDRATQTPYVTSKTLNERKGIIMLEQRKKQLRKEKRLIEVTRDFIRIGEREELCGCPVYYALKCALGQEIGAVYGTMVQLHRDEGGPECRVYNIKLPRKVRFFIKRFDEGKSVKPFSFEIDVPTRAAAGL